MYIYIYSSLPIHKHIYIFFIIDVCVKTYITISLFFAWLGVTRCDCAVGAYHACVLVVLG